MNKKIFIITIIALLSLVYMSVYFYISNNMTFDKLFDYKIEYSSLGLRLIKFKPVIQLKDLSIYEKNTTTKIAKVAIANGHLSLIESIKSKNIQLAYVEVINPELTISYDNVSGVALNNKQLDWGEFISGISVYGKTRINHGMISIIDRYQQKLVISDLQGWLNKNDKYYQMVMDGIFNYQGQEPININLNIKGNVDSVEPYDIDYSISTPVLNLSAFEQYIPLQKISGTIKNFSFEGSNLDGNWKIFSGVITGGNTNILVDGNKIDIEQFSGVINYELNDGVAIISSPNSLFNFDDTNLLANYKISLQDKQAKLIEMNAKTSYISLQNFKQLFLKFLPNKVNSWLDNSLEKGNVRHASLSIHHDKWNFSLDFFDTTVNYLDAWPKLIDMAGELKINNTDLLIKTLKGRISNSEIASLYASIKDYHSNNYLKINGEMQTELALGVDFIKRSKLRVKQIFDNFKHVRANDPLQLKLNIDVPLVVNQPLLIDGSLKISDSSFYIDKLKIDDCTASINFDNHSISTKNLTFSSYGNKFKGKAKADDNGLEIDLDSNLLIKDLEQYNFLPARTFYGGTDYNMHIKLPAKEKKYIIDITSNLYGLKIDLPDPLSKEEASSRSFKATINKTTNGHKIQLLLNQGFEAKLILRDSVNLTGHIDIGTNPKSDWTTKEQLLISGTFAGGTFDTNKVYNLLKSEIFTSVLQVNLFVNKLLVLNQEFNKVWIGYDNINHLIHFDGAKINGDLKLPRENSEVYLLDLNELYLMLSKHNKIFENKVQLYPIDFNCNKLTINNLQSNDVKIKLIPKTYGYEIFKLNAGDDDFNLTSQGKWHFIDKNYTEIVGSIRGNKIGNYLDKYGIASSIVGGKGNIDFIFDWIGNPSDFSFKNLTGSTEINLTRGQITGVNPGLGKILGLLSIDNIQKRLRLDFSDLLSKGLVFDLLKTSIFIKDGKMSTDKLLIDSPSATIEMFGNVMLDSQQLDFMMAITPKVTGTLPLAAAVASGNPAIGAVFWIFDKTSRKKPTDLTRYQYAISGTWGRPEVKELRNS